MAEVYCNVDITPYPLSNLSVKDDFGDEISINDMGTFYRVEAQEATDITISADGYITQTVTILTDTNVVLIQSKYISNISDGTNTYIIKDASALHSAEEALPSQTSQSGKFLTTNGTTASWEDVDALPDQTGKNGKYLKTNGTTATWEDAASTTTITYWTDD